MQDKVYQKNLWISTENLLHRTLPSCNMMGMNHLKKDVYLQVSGLVFLAAAILHGWRALNGWELVYNEWMVPVWASWVAAAILLYLAYNAFYLKK